MEETEALAATPIKKKRTVTFSENLDKDTFIQAIENIHEKAIRINELKYSYLQKKSFLVTEEEEIDGILQTKQFCQIKKVRSEITELNYTHFIDEINTYKNQLDAQKIENHDINKTKEALQTFRNQAEEKISLIKIRFLTKAHHLLKEEAPSYEANFKENEEIQASIKALKEAVHLGTEAINAITTNFDHLNKITKTREIQKIQKQNESILSLYKNLNTLREQTQEINRKLSEEYTHPTKQTNLHFFQESESKKEIANSFNNLLIPFDSLELNNKIQSGSKATTLLVLDDNASKIIEDVLKPFNNKLSATYKTFEKLKTSEELKTLDGFEVGANIALFFFGFVIITAIILAVTMKDRHNSFFLRINELLQLIDDFESQVATTLESAEQINYQHSITP